ncbi:MAG: S1C family serine protease [Planctomycetota bacterium]
MMSPIDRLSSSASQCIAALFAIFVSAPLWAGDNGNAFELATSLAQSRVVKIFGAKVGRTPGYATGLIVGTDGEIITANGTYLNGERIRVVLPDGSSHLAKAVRRSRVDQMALLKIPVQTEQYFDLSQSSSVFKGQWVLSVSNLFKIADGSEPASVMLGVVSLKTTLEAKRGNQAFPYEGAVVLLDAISSNPGAPGGAVVDANTGDLVGMIGPVLQSRSSGTKLNYAIPAAVLREFVERDSPIKVDEKRMLVGKPHIGIKLFRLDGKRAPAYVDRVTKGSPAAEAGLRPDDAILGIGDERIKTVQQYDEVSKTLTPGESIEFAVKRGNRLLQIMLTPTTEEAQTP